MYNHCTCCAQHKAADAAFKKATTILEDARNTWPLFKKYEKEITEEAERRNTSGYYHPKLPVELFLQDIYNDVIEDSYEDVTFEETDDN